MKTILLLSLLSFLCRTGFAQRPDSSLHSPQKRYDYYQQAYQQNIKTGRGVLYTGLGCLAAGGGLVLIDLNSSREHDYGSVTQVVGLGLMAVGIGASIVSIPFFVSAGTSKRKARLALRSSQISFGESATQKLPYTTVGLFIPL